VHSSQDVTADTTHAVFGAGSNRALLYVAITRGRDSNRAYLYEMAEANEHTQSQPDGGNNRAAAALMRAIVSNDSRTQTVHDVAADTDREQLPVGVARLVLDRRCQVVLVGDAHQLAPVKARGGMFAQLCEDLPSAQKLSEVWRMRDADERTASLALRNGGPATVRRAIGCTAPTTACIAGTRSPWPPTPSRPTALTPPPAKTHYSSATPPKWPTP
jgi:hypothetical protein